MQASINAKPTFVATVEIRRPGEDGPMKFRGIFKHRTKDQFAAFAQASKDAPQPDLDAVLDVLVGWEEMAEEFSRDNVASLLQNFHQAADDIARTYVRELGPARLGN